MNTYVSGTRVRSIANFTNAAGAAADPDTITFKYRAGTGAVQTVTNTTKDATGTYHFDMDTTGWSGPDLQLWTTQWEGTGAVQVKGDDYFSVKAPAL